MLIKLQFSCSGYVYYTFFYILGDIQNLFGRMLVQIQKLPQKTHDPVTAEVEENHEYSVY